MKYKIIQLYKKNIKDFASERNTLIKQSNSDWIFFVDSDEKISARLKKELDGLSQNSRYSAYFIKRKNYFLGQYIGTDKIVRLIKKGSGKWVRKVHEIYKSDQKASRLKNELIHNTADNLGDYLIKINNYSTLHSTANLNEGKTSNIFKIIFFPIFKFMQTLFKSKNVVFSIMQSFHSYLAWSKQYLNKNKK